MNPTTYMGSNMLEPIMRTLRQLSPSSQSAVAELFWQLAERGGLNLRETGARGSTPGLPGPARGQRARLWLSGATVVIEVVRRRLSGM